MSEDKETKTNILKVLGVGLGLPSSILGVFFFVYYLIEQKYITPTLGLLLILAIVSYFFYLMIRYANKK